MYIEVMSTKATSNKKISKNVQLNLSTFQDFQGRGGTLLRDVCELRMRSIYDFKLCYIVRNCVVSTVLACLYELCLPVKEVVHCQRLRSDTDDTSLCPSCHNGPSFPRAFAVTDPQLWNQSPVTTRATSANTSDCFKRALKTFLL